VFLQYVVDILLDKDCYMQLVLGIPGAAAGHGGDVLAGCLATTASHR
jgi:hypothetical protein